MKGCPGQDMGQWKREDIAFVACPSCGEEVEIWKDEPVRQCPKCGKPVCNPRTPQDCEKWCAHAIDCPGVQMKQRDGK